MCYEDTREKCENYGEKLGRYQFLKMFVLRFTPSLYCPHVHLLKLDTNDDDFDHWVMQHEDGHGVSAQELAQSAGAQPGQQGLALIPGEAQDHQELEVAQQ